MLHGLAVEFEQSFFGSRPESCEVQFVSCPPNVMEKLSWQSRRGDMVAV
jgi:hypothetical protein